MDSKNKPMPQNAGMKEKGEIGHSGSVEKITPFNFQGTVNELPKDYRGTTKKAFDY